VSGMISSGSASDNAHLNHLVGKRDYSSKSGRTRAIGGLELPRAILFSLTFLFGVEFVSCAELDSGIRHANLAP